MNMENLMKRSQEESPTKNNLRKLKESPWTRNWLHLFDFWKETKYKSILQSL